MVLVVLVVVSRTTVALYRAHGAGVSVPRASCAVPTLGSRSRSITGKANDDGSGDGGSRRKGQRVTATAPCVAPPDAAAAAAAAATAIAAAAGSIRFNR